MYLKYIGNIIQSQFITRKHQKVELHNCHLTGEIISNKICIDFGSSDYQQYCRAISKGAINLFFLHSKSSFYSYFFKEVLTINM